MSTKGGRVQLGEPTSPVNLRDLALAHRLDERRRCYRWWFWLGEKGEEDAVPGGCPRCSRALEVRFAGERPQGGSLMVCERCSIAIAV